MTQNKSSQIPDIQEVQARLEQCEFPGSVRDAR
jgi:hypothetical protein